VEDLANPTVPETAWTSALRRHIAGDNSESLSTSQKNSRQPVREAILGALRKATLL
jgi:hypothetical protein